MDLNPMQNSLFQYNGILKENDDLYRGIARVFGLSDCAFWILYTLREADKPLTQSEICSTIYVAKQTVHSALKKLAYDGYIELEKAEHQKNKLLHLTPKGEALAQATVDRVIDIECKALSKLGRENVETFIGLFQKYTDLLKNYMTEIKP